MIFGNYHQNQDIQSVKNSAASLLHAENMRAIVFCNNRSLTLGGVYREGYRNNLSYNENGGIHACIYGVVYKNNSLLKHEDIFKCIFQGKDTWLRGLDGSYAIAIARENVISVFTDPMNSVPMQFGVHNRGFSFAPEGKAVLSQLKLPAKLNIESAYNLIQNRYILGNKTLFSGVHRLAPGEELAYKIDDNEVVASKYWDLDFKSEIDKPREASKALHNALKSSHDKMLSELAPNDTYGMFLTGGLDSRGILAFTKDLQNAPEIALTWGGKDHIKLSDPAISREMASDAGVPFDFCEIKGDDLPEHAAEWVWVNEGLSDNANSYATPCTYFHKWGYHKHRFTVLGDEMFGAGPIPQDIQGAINNNFKNTFQCAESLLPTFLNPGMKEVVNDGFKKEINALVAQSGTSSPKDIQDYLFFHTYIAKWILAPGNFKYPMYSVRRPLMTKEVLDVVCRFSPLLRVDKTAYLRMLKDYFPHMLNYPVTSQESGVNWAELTRNGNDLNQYLRKNVSTEKIEALSFKEIFSAQKLDDFLKDFFTSEIRESQSLNQGRLRKNLYGMRRQLSKNKTLASVATRIQPMVLSLIGQSKSESNALHHQFVMRLNLLTLFEECLNDGQFDLGQDNPRTQRLLQDRLSRVELALVQ
ncbi:MAG: hypothetical protein JJU29_13105 [Verrucomicrobia bacterium]|nr:hypothetical protein [Verrucomicrobiota bacterium]